MKNCKLVLPSVFEQSKHSNNERRHKLELARSEQGLPLVNLKDKSKLFHCKTLLQRVN